MSTPGICRLGFSTCTDLFGVFGGVAVGLLWAGAVCIGVLGGKPRGLKVRVLGYGLWVLSGAVFWWSAWASGAHWWNG